MGSCFVPADILLPDFELIDGSRWAVIACDQFTSKPEYWENVRSIVGDSPSALDFILPEVYLGRKEEFLLRIRRCMESDECARIFREYKNTMVYLERTQSDGRLRRGIVGAVDLECYDWRSESESLIRATEGTVAERIPPRVEIRKDAAIELPHVMLLADDPEDELIGYFAERKERLKKAYDFDLMLGGGHVSAWFIENSDDIAHVTQAVGKLSSPDSVYKKYGIKGKAPLAIAVGDGNHSLAAAKAVYEKLKAEIGEEAAKNSPVRYALAELVNIHDTAIDFEPIYRVVFNTEPEDIIGKLKEYAATIRGVAAPQTVRAVYAEGEEDICIEHPEHSLTVGTLQNFLDDYISKHPGSSVDYIHGKEEAKALSRAERSVAFIFDGMGKSELFSAVIRSGSLPRKTFSMGRAEDKRYYVEARRLK